MTINFNQPPYFDDYNEEDKFYKILFRPGYAVQTRELNQLQTILQKQVSRFGSGIYKEGSMVIPGGLGYKNNFAFVKLTGAMTSLVVSGGNESETTISTPTTIESIIKASVGKRVIGLGVDPDNPIAGAQGTIKWYRLATDNDPLTLYIEYDNSGEDGQSFVFNNAETITIRDTEVVSESDYIGHRVRSVAINATGEGSVVDVQRGVYFTRGNFVLVEPQTLLLDPYGTTPTYRVGFRVFESIITPEIDSSLSDNANGSFNFSAPGAHRHSIELQLHKLEINSVDDTDFVELFKVQDGNRESHITKTEYSELAKELARRTYDESGDYTVSAFRMNAKESRNNNRGEWTPSTAFIIGDVITSTITTVENDTSVTRVRTYTAATSGTSGGTQPSHTAGTFNDGTVTWLFEPYPVYNGGQSLDGDQNKMTIAIEPGKAYVRGFEIEKPSSSFVEVNKARDFAQVNNDLLATTIGNFVICDSFIGIPDITTFEKVKLYRNLDATGEVVGSARIRGLERDNEGTFQLYLMSVQMNPGFEFSRDVKSIGSFTGNNFSCSVVDINPNIGPGNVTLSSTAVTGLGTNFLATFKVGDYINIVGNYFKITARSSATELTVENPNSAAFAAAPYRLFLTSEIDPDRITTIFPLGKSYIKSVRNELGEVPVVNTSYVIMQKANITLTGGETSKTISLSNVSDSTGVGSAIDPNTQVSEIIVARADEEFLDPSSLSISVSGDRTSFTLSGLDPETPQYTVFFPVTKNTPTTAGFKTKTLKTYQTKTITVKDAIEARVISLDVADAYRIRQVLMASETGPITANSNLVDITDHFALDNGQRDTHYDIATIIRKPSYGAPSGSIRIIYDFFEHSEFPKGDYFCADSYTNILLENIPTYTGSNGVTYRLSDVLDFRPRISNTGDAFTGVGSSLSMPPKPGTSTSVDYTYYLPRMDRISLDVNGQFVVTKGSSGESSIPPETPSLMMSMAVVDLKPYTEGPQDVFIQKIDNRRYTMRDIGALEKRIDNLEYYTSLSLLEQEASSLQLQDEFGLNRFKNGFIVDNFTSHTVADATSNDFRASIDTEGRQLRPSFTMDNINLIEKATRANRSGYQVTNDLVTLPYSETNFISQLYASRPENINPFAIFTFIGQAELNPPSDEWIETRRLPDVINDVEGNFSAVLANVQAAGVLGTQWNAWETNWTGTSTRDATRGGFVRRQGIAVFRTTTQTEGQSRTGINTTVQATFSREIVNDRVVSTSVVPWIRSRHVVFLARSMRLNTVVYPFFDKTNVSQYITPASRVEFKGMNPTDAEDIDKFDFETNVGSDNDEKARRFNGNVQTAYNKGDVVYLKQRGATVYLSADTSICTGVCVLQEVQPGGTTRSALLVNTTGSFQPGDIIAGSISGAEVEVVSFQLGQKGGQLMTNFGGDVAGVFDIPSTAAAQFSTGTREFKLIDNLQNNDLVARTRAHGNYRAEGVLQTWQATFNSVRNGEIVRNRVSDSRTVTSIIGDTQIGWVDPLAQTFLVQNQGGAFITSIDIWFASVDPVKPVTIQIREVVNGYPGKVILPFSATTLHPYQLRDENQPPGFGLSANRVMFEGTQYLAPDKPTKFTLKAPVYVQDLTEYCIVLLSDSNNYHVWTSNLGGIDLTSPTPRLISEQPYAGVLFKSQNASTWTASQNEDLTFRINVAQFDQAGVAEFQNSRLGTLTLEENPFFTRNLSKLVRVFHPNHGFIVGSKVTLSGVSNTTSTNGINIVDLNKTHDILSADQDTYVIRATTAANRTGRMGGSEVVSSFNIKFDIIHPIVQHQNFSDTALTFGIKTTSSRAVSGGQQPGILSTSFVPVIANENNDFFNPQMACSADNEALYLNGAKSVAIQAVMSTNNSYLSPVIDLSRFSLITVNNRIDAQTYESANYIGNDQVDGDGEFDRYTLSSNAFITFSGNRIITTDSDTRGIFASQRPGKYLLVSGAAQTLNNGVHRIVSIEADGSSITTASNFTTEAEGSTVTVKIYDNFIDEAAKDGSAIAKYLTKRVDLSNSSGVSNNLNIRFNADVPPAAFVEVYYKVGLVASATPFEDVAWELWTTQSVTQGPRDVSFDITGLPSFNAVAVKLVMKSSNSAAVPKISDFIVVATS